MLTPRVILQTIQRATRVGRPLDSDELASIAGWSTAHVHRRFRATTTLTPKQWSSRQAVLRALIRLRSTDDPLSVIARDTGYASHEVMTRAFKRILGVPPSALRGGQTDQLHHAACFALHHVTLTPRSPPMTPTITLETRDPVPFLFQRRTVAPDGMQPAMAEILPAVFVHCQQQGIAFAGPPTTRYAATTRGRFTLEVGMPVVTAPATETIEAGELAGGLLAVAVHTGSYDTLGDTHAALETWAEENGHAPCGSPWEAYLTDPGEVPNPAEWKTEVCLPVAPRT